MYKTLLGRVYNVLTHRRLILFYFVLLTVLLITLVQTHFNISLGEVVKKNGLSLTLVFLLSVSFILLKSCAWFWAWRSQEICVSYVGSLKLFLMASFVDLLVYPSKISSDLFLISYFKGYKVIQRVRAILLFRVATSLPFLIVTGIFLMKLNFIFVVLGLAALALLIKSRPKYMKRLGQLAPFWKVLVSIMGVTVVLIFFELARVSLLLGMFQFRPSVNFLLWFIFAHSLGVASGMPAGLGVKDATLGMYLKGHLSISEIASFLLLLRGTAEVFAALLGWCVAGQKILNCLPNAGHQRLPPSSTEQINS